MSKKHRVAVVGCGAMPQSAHLPNIQENPRFELVATCDIDPKVAEDCCKRFGAKRFETDYKKIISAKDIDVCVLATHTNLRGAFIIPALEAGKPVYTEKPLAPSRKEMMDIVKTCRRTKVPVCVGHNRRSGPAVLEFKRLLDKAKSGVPVRGPSVDRSGGKARLPEEKQTQILMRVNDDARSWKPWVFEDEDCIMHMEMVHFIDLALWFNEGFPVRAIAEGSNRGNFTLILRFNDGSSTTLFHTLIGNFDYPKELFEATTRNVTITMEQHIEVRQCGLMDEPIQTFIPLAGKSDMMKGDGLDAYLKGLQTEHHLSVKEKRAPRWIAQVDKGHATQLNRFLDHIEGKGENPCPVESAVIVNRIALRLIESARSGLPVAIGPEDWHIPDA